MDDSSDEWIYIDMNLAAKLEKCDHETDLPTYKDLTIAVKDIRSLSDQD